MSLGVCVNLCLELVADVCSCISGFHAVLCTLLRVKVFWCSLMNYWCVWTVKCYLEALYHNVYRSESVLLGLDGGLSLCCCVNPLHYFFWHLYSTRGSSPQSLGALIKVVPKLVVCILQPEQALHRRCWSTVPGKYWCLGHSPLECCSLYAESPQPPPIGHSAQMNTH